MKSLSRPALFDGAAAEGGALGGVRAGGRNGEGLRAAQFEVGADGDRHRHGRGGEPLAKPHLAHPSSPSAGSRFVKARSERKNAPGKMTVR